MPGKRWSLAEKEKLKKMLNLGLTDKEIAKKFQGRSRDAIERKRIDLELYKEHQSPYSNSYLLKKLKEFASKLGKTPTFTELRENADLPDPATYASRFGSYKKACKKAGLLSAKKITTEELKSDIQKLCQELGYLPRANQIRNASYTKALETYYKRANTYKLNKLFKWAGVYDEYLTKGLKKLTIELGRTPKVKEIKSSDYTRSYSYYRNQLGNTLEEIKEKAGLFKLEQKLKKNEKSSLHK